MQEPTCSMTCPGSVSYVKPVWPTDALGPRSLSKVVGAPEETCWGLDVGEPAAETRTCCRGDEGEPLFANWVEP